MVTTLAGVRGASGWAGEPGHEGPGGRSAGWMLGPLLTPDRLRAPPEVQRALLTLGHATRDYIANTRLGHAAQNSSQRPVFGRSSMTRAVAVLWTMAAPLSRPTSSRRRI